MFFYFTIILFLLMFSIGRLGNIKQRTILCITMFLLWFLATIRSLEIGNDTQTYYNLYMNICRNHNLELFLSRYERGYLWLNELISHITNNFWIFLSIVNTIIYYAYYKFIDKYSMNPLLSVFLFFVLGIWGQTMNIIRLQLALAMIIYAFFFKEKKKRFLSIVCILVAVMFQRVSIVYVIGFFMPKKITRKGYAIAVIGTVVIYIFLPSFMVLIARYIPYFNIYLTSSTYVLDDTKIASIMGLLMRLVVFAFGLSIYLKNYRGYDLADKNGEEENFSMQINMVFIAMLIMVVSLRFNLFDRCGYFFWLFGFVLIPNTIKRIQSKNNRKLAVGLVMILSILYFVIINIYRPDWNHIYPYSTVLFKKTN